MMYPEQIVNIIIIMAILLTASIMTYRFTRKNYNVPEQVPTNVFSVEYLQNEVKKILDRIQNENINDLNLNKRESEKRENNRNQIRRALRTCSTGDGGAKAVVLEIIRKIIQTDLGVNEETINKIIPFHSTELNAADKFAILMQVYMQEYGSNALTELILKYDLAKEKKKGAEEYYEITEEDIHSVYSREANMPDYGLKLAVVSQRIYERFKGHGAADILREMNIDGIHGGLSGLPFNFYSNDIEWLETVKKQHLNSFDSIWIFFQGKTIRLSYLGFGSNKELIRVCKNIYRYGNPGQLSEARGYIVNEAKDGARITVYRPGFSAGWAFVVRKYDTIPKKEFDAVVTDEGSEIIKTLLKYMVKMKLTIIITGEMGCGKTTFLMALIDFLRKTSRIRSFEKLFELYINKHFPTMNVLALRKTEYIHGQQALDAMLTSDGNVTILGEVGTYEEVNLLMSIKEKNPDTTLATCHTDKARDLIRYFAKGLNIAGGFNDAIAAEREVANLLDIEVHWVNINGHRHIERITEIYPKETNISMEKPIDYIIEMSKNFIDPTPYETKDIIVFEKGRYVVKNKFSERTEEKMLKYLNRSENEELEQLFNSGEVVAYD